MLWLTPWLFLSLGDLLGDSHILYIYLILLAFLAAVDKLETLVNTRRLKRIIAAWHIVAKDARRAKEYFKV